ncbi:MAG: cation-translocating P-type ATPase [Simkaniaceae bacterium]|nr:cation-translocating P-type ATPase [Simkaniaceae bacterium]
MTRYMFDDFFASNREESASPFLTENSRKWSKNLALKSASLAALFLATSFVCSFRLPAISGLLLLFVYFLAGTPSLCTTIEDLKHGEVNIDVLMTVAALLSFIIGSQMEGGLLLVLFTFSGAMEKSVSKKATGTLIKLRELSPTFVTVIDEEGGVRECSVRDIAVGTRILIKAGEIIPLDGSIVSGRSFVNLVHLTGESLPVAKGQGDEVRAGSRNMDGTLTVSVEKTSAESTLSRIISLIHKAHAMKPHVERVFDRFGKYYAVAVMVLFVLFAGTLPCFLPISYLGVEGSFYRALAFLITASPCALIIATPTAYLSALSACAKRGILPKGGVALDAFAKCRSIAFDKTGTLTTGTLACDEVVALSSSPLCTIDEAIRIVASLERHVTHPMTEAIIALATRKGLAMAETEDFRSVPGYGISGVVEGRRALVGNKAFVLSSLKESREIEKVAIDEERSVTFLLIESPPQDSLFAFYFKDVIRPDAAQALRELREKYRLSLVMLTGDHEQSARSTAKKLGIEDVYADLRPQHKLDMIAKLAGGGKGLAMVGDGVNDAPALACATVGISMGEVGSDTAIDASDIVLLKSQLTLISYLYGKARQTVRIVKQNLILALGVICLTTTPALSGVVPLWLAVILHEGGTVLVGLNSLRLLRT